MGYWQNYCCISHYYQLLLLLILYLHKVKDYILVLSLAFFMIFCFSNNDCRKSWIFYFFVSFYLWPCLFTRYNTKKSINNRFSCWIILFMLLYCLLSPIFLFVAKLFKFKFFIIWFFYKIFKNEVSFDDKLSKIFLEFWRTFLLLVISIVEMLIFQKICVNNVYHYGFILWKLWSYFWRFVVLISPWAKALYS